MKERMITRTVVTNICNVVAVNMENMTVEKLSIPATVEYDTVEKADKYFRKNWNVTGLAFAKVESITKEEKLYGMSEIDFIKYARELPPRGTKEE